MTRINLLPWRTNRAQKQTQAFLKLFGLCWLVTLICMEIIHTRVESLQNAQTQRNQFLQKELNHLADRTRQAEAQQRLFQEKQQHLNKIMDMDQKLWTLVDFFHDLAEKIPADVYLTELIQTDKGLTLTGLARNEEAITDFLRTVASLPPFVQSELSLLETRRGEVQTGYQQKFTARLLMPETLSTQEKSPR